MIISANYKHIIVLETGNTFNGAFSKIVVFEVFFSVYEYKKSGICKIMKTTDDGLILDISTAENKESSVLAAVAGMLSLANKRTPLSNLRGGQS